jgi:hypothetical protein
MAKMTREYWTHILNYLITTIKLKWELLIKP